MPKLQKYIKRFAQFGFYEILKYLIFPIFNLNLSKVQGDRTAMSAPSRANSIIRGVMKRNYEN